MYLDEENYTQPCDFPSSEFSYCVQREGASPSPCTSMRKFIRSLAISPIGILILRIKGGGVSVPVYLDKENYTQP